MKKKSTKKIELNSDSNNDSPILDLNNSVIKDLIKEGKKTGYITHDQLNAALPSGELSSE